MKFISRLAKGSLKSNKSKSLLIGITIMLTTVLLTSIGIICAGWIESNKEVTIERSGSHHALYKRATYDEIRVIENNIDIEKFGVMTTVGISSFEGNNLGIAYLDENGKEMANVEFVQGVMPKSNDEIAIQDGYLKLLGQEVKVGDKIKLEYESRGTGILKEKEFTISGLMKTSDFNVGNKNYSAVISEQFLRQEEAYVDMEFNTYVRVNDEDNLSGNDIEFKVKEVATNVGINEYDVRINEDYINAMKPDMGVVGGGIAIVLIVILSSILVIYSIFYVSIITKVQEYGKLRAVGATKRQIKCIILREGMVLAAIAIPIGLVVGYFVGDTIIDKLVIKGMYEVENLMYL